VGDIVVVRPVGEKPVDGKIIEGYSSVDESMPQERVFLLRKMQVTKLWEKC
jgi:high-affinity K+ transport system ATPase subunit B